MKSWFSLLLSTSPEQNGIAQIECTWYIHRQSGQNQCEKSSNNDDIRRFWIIKLTQFCGEIV
jgi:hypothetical protein